MKFQPGAIRFPVYQISNPQDLATLYYIRVVVKRTSDLSVVKTLNLVSQGNGLYGGVNYQIPQDPSGQGYQLFETTSVYTDSGYTSLSPNYEIVNTPIDVGYEITNASGLGGGGGGYDLTDYQTIRKLIKEELEVFLAVIEKSKPKESSFNNEKLEKLILGLSGLMQSYKDFVQVELKGHREDVVRGFEGINNNVVGVNDSISKIPLKEMFSGLSPYFQNLFDGLTDLGKKHETLAKNFDGVQTSHQDSLKELQQQLSGALTGTTQEFRDILSEYFSSVDTIIHNKGTSRQDRKEVEKPDYLKIADRFIRTK